MDYAETLTLYSQGKDAWNSWASNLLSEQDRLKRTGSWAAQRSGVRLAGHNEATRRWSSAANVCFSGHVFEGDADFGGLVFPGDADFDAQFNCQADFRDVLFLGGAWFSNARFYGACAFNRTEFVERAGFEKVIFHDEARFERAVFRHNAWFSDALFTRLAEFRGTTITGSALFERTGFESSASFSQVTFEGYSSFKDATFKDAAGFPAIQADRAFVLDSAQFADVPDFRQAHFAEAPQLEGLWISVNAGSSKAAGIPSVDLSGRFRALKRLAAQGFDHDREQIYFAAELKSLRGIEDKLFPWFWKDRSGGRRFGWPGGSRYWFGLAYQILSDFGRSLIRPILWWQFAIAVFSWYYLAQYAAQAKRNLSYFDIVTMGFAGNLRCIVGDGDASRYALLYALRKGLVVIGENAEVGKQALLCLYGFNASYSEVRDRNDLIAMVPDQVALASAVHSLVSIALVFLLLLAVRNHFRIK